MLLERDGEHVNHKRVHRIYCEEGLAMRRKKRKHCVRGASPLGIYTEANQEWALDFVHDTTAFGRSIRVLNVIDAYPCSAGVVLARSALKPPLPTLA